MAIFRDAGKLGVLLLQLSPAFSPRKHQLSELEPLIEMMGGYDLAIEFRNRNWAIGDRLRIDNWICAKAWRDFRERGLACIGSFHGDAIGRGRSDELRTSHICVCMDATRKLTSPAKLWLRVSITITARSEIAEVAERSRRLAKEARELHVDFQQQQSRLRAARSASFAQSAGSNRQERRHRQQELF